MVNINHFASRSAMAQAERILMLAYVRATSVSGMVRLLAALRHIRTGSEHGRITIGSLLFALTLSVVLWTLILRYAVPALRHVVEVLP